MWTFYSSLPATPQYLLDSGTLFVMTYCVLLGCLLPMMIWQRLEEKQ